MLLMLEYFDILHTTSRGDPFPLATKVPQNGSNPPAQNFIVFPRLVAACATPVRGPENISLMINTSGRFYIRWGGMGFVHREYEERRKGADLGMLFLPGSAGRGGGCEGVSCACSFSSQAQFCYVGSSAQASIQSSTACSCKDIRLLGTTYKTGTAFGIQGFRLRGSG